MVSWGNGRYCTDSLCCFMHDENKFLKKLQNHHNGWPPYHYRLLAINKSGSVKDEVYACPYLRYQFSPNDGQLSATGECAIYDKRPALCEQSPKGNTPCMAFFMSSNPALDFIIEADLEAFPIELLKLPGVQQRRKKVLFRVPGATPVPDLGPYEERAESAKNRSGKIL